MEPGFCRGFGFWCFVFAHVDSSVGFLFHAGSPELFGPLSRHNGFILSLGVAKTPLKRISKQLH